MTRLLIIEDNQVYIESAKKFFGGIKNVTVTYAKDYDEAANNLNSTQTPDIIISDLFFPAKTGSNDKRLGQIAITMMIDSDPKEKILRLAEAEYSRYADIDKDTNKDLRNMLRTHLNYCPPEEISLDSNGLLLSLKRANEQLGRENTTEILKRSLSLMPKEKGQKDYYWERDHYLAMEEALNKSEQNQALGILIGDLAKKVGIPFIVVTSTHHHENVAEIPTRYLLGKGIGFIEDARKETEEPWKEAFKRVQQMAKTKEVSKTRTRSQ